MEKDAGIHCKCNFWESGWHLFCVEWCWIVWILVLLNTTKADKGGFEKRCISLTKCTLFKQWKTMIVGMFCILFILHMNFLNLIIENKVFLRISFSTLISPILEAKKCCRDNFCRYYALGFHYIIALWSPEATQKLSSFWIVRTLMKKILTEECNTPSIIKVFPCHISMSGSWLTKIDVSIL